MSIKIVSNEQAEREEIFFDNFRHIVRIKGISYNTLAKKLDVNVSTVISYRMGRTFPNEERIEQLAEALECTVDDLFDETYKPWEFGKQLNN